MFFPLLLMGSGFGLLAYFVFGKNEDGPVPDHPPDVTNPPPGSTGYKRIDMILPGLKKAADETGIPLGVLVGWIAKESGGKLAKYPQPGKGDTDLDERGLFQLMPAESEALGLDHRRLSTDVNYSIHAGILLIQKYMTGAEKFGIAQKGTNFFWKLVKLIHTVGGGAAKKWIDAAQEAGSIQSWEAFEKYATAHDSELLHLSSHSPLKWLPFIDLIARVGAPFGFGSSDAVVGADFPDIIDPLDCIKT